MAEFIAKGRITFEDVTFYIEADNLNCAQLIAFTDQYHSYSIDDAEVCDVSISAASVMENK